MEVNKIYCENCLDTMARMPDNFIDLTVTSPPYDDLREYHGCEWNLKIFQQVAQELYRVTKPGGVVVWVVNDKTENGSETLTSFLQAIYFRFFAGFFLHDTMIYKKDFYVPLTHNRFEQSFEYMFVFSKSKPKTFNPIKVKTLLGGKKSTLTHRKTGEQPIRGTGYGKSRNNYRIAENLRVYQPQRGEKHPAVFPDELAHEMIYSWSNEGDLVYDPFGGSGTTAKMAHIMKRNWIMSEISEEYCKLAQKGLEPYLNQLDLDI